MYNSVSNATQVANLSQAACKSYENALQAAIAAQSPDGVGTNTDALYYYDSSISMPSYLRIGLANGTVVAAPIDGGINSVSGGGGYPQYFYQNAGH